MSEGEIRSLARRLHWQPARMRALQTLLGRLIVVPLPYGNVVDAYAMIEEMSLNNGRTMQKNDLWIAATAYETGARLLTTDHDFGHLSSAFIDLDWIDPASHL